MEDTVLQRIKSLINSEGISITSLSKSIGIPQPTLNRQINGESSMNLITINSLLNYYKDVSAEWIMRGEVA